MHNVNFCLAYTFASLSNCNQLLLKSVPDNIFDIPNGMFGKSLFHGLITIESLRNMSETGLAIMRGHSSLPIDQRTQVVRELLLFQKG